MKKLIIISTLLIMQISFVAANTNIVVVDMEKILNVTKVGASIQNQLTKINNEIQMDFKKQEEKLKNKEIKLISQKNIVKGDEISTERTYTEVVKLESILDTEVVDWANIGQIMSILMLNK